MAWMYLTPVLYSVDMIPEDLRKVFMLNPMVPIIDAYREVLYYGGVPNLKSLLNGFILGVLFLAAGFIVFGKLKSILRRNYSECYKS